MNVKFICFSISLLLSLSSSVLGQENNAQTDDASPWGDIYDTVVDYGANAISVNSSGAAFGEKMPYANFTHYAPVGRHGSIVASGGIDFGVNMSCTGLTADAIFDNKIGQYETIIENASSLMPSLIIYYLMYRYPTVAHYADKIEGGFEWAVGLANLSCSDVKELAKKDPFKNGDEMAKAKCDADSGGNNLDCFEKAEEEKAEVRKDYLDEFSSKATEMVSKVTDMVNKIPLVEMTAGNAGESAPRSTFVSRSIDTSCFKDEIALVNGSFNYTKTIFALGMLDCPLWKTVGLLLPEYTQNRDDEKSDLVVDAHRDNDKNPRITVGTLTHQYRKEILRLIERLVNSAPAPGKNFQSLSNKDLTVIEASRIDSYNDALLELTNRVQTPILSEMIVQLRYFKGENPRRYQSAIKEMATQYAEIQMTLDTLHLAGAIHYGLALQTNAKFPEAFVEGMDLALTSIRYGLEEITQQRLQVTKAIREQRKSLGLDTGI